MSLVVLERTEVAFGARPLWSGLSWTLAAGERWALLGPNGSGKSTLLAVLAGQRPPDAGVRRTRANLTLALVGQKLDLDPSRSALDTVVEAAPGRTACLARIARLEARLEAASGEGAGEAAAALAEAHERLAAVEARFPVHRAARILAGLGIDPSRQGRPVGELSGGLAMRVALARALFVAPDVLLLDEPTNHLDVDSVRWLAGFLPTLDAAQVVVTHDLEFAERVANRVASFEPEGVCLFPGTPSAYRTHRARAAETLERRARNEARARRQAERFVERFRAKASKARAVRSRVRALERMEAEAPVRSATAGRRAAFRFSCGVPSGRVPLRIEGLEKGYGGPPVLRGVEAAALRGQKIGIVGANGAGKTTLLRVLAGELTPDAGTVTWDPKAVRAFFGQHHAEGLPAGSTVVEVARQAAPDASSTRLRAALGAVGLGDDDADKPVAVLSGGERARLALACTMIRPANVLLLDEPTNHLDAGAAEALAEAVADHEGTVLFVSHHLGFLRRAADTIWRIADGRVEVHPGSFDDYEARTSREPADPGAFERSAQTARAAGEGRGAARDDGRARGRAARRLRDRRRKLEARLATLEDDLARAQAAVESAGRAFETADGAGDPASVQARARAYEEARERLEAAEAAWLEAAEALEALDAELEALVSRPGS